MDRNKIKKVVARSWVLMALIFFLGLNARLSGREDDRKGEADDLKVIRQAIAKGFSRENQGKEARSISPRWVKIWIKNEIKPAEEIKITLPVVLVDFLVARAELCQKHKTNSLDSENDFAFLRQAGWKKATRVKFLDVWKELKSLGPASVIELKGEEGFFRIWLE